MENSLPQKIIGKIDFSGDCWNWTGCKTKGQYGKLKEKGKSYFAHRYVWACLNGKIPDGLCILHACDNPSCVKPEHLFIGTNMDNSKDCKAKGRVPKGERHKLSRLTIAQVEEIRKTYQRQTNGEFSLAGLSNKFGVSQSHISEIISNKKWVA